MAALALAALPVAVSAPAHAVDACTSRTVSQPFTAWGDSNDYFLVTSGTFESGTSGWSTGSGVSTVAGNEPWYVTGGASSLNIPAGSSVSAPEMCLAPTEDSVRFFYKPPGSGTGLGVTIKATNSITHVVAQVSFSLRLDGVSSWQVSPRISLPDVRGSQGTENVVITLNAQGAPWQIDDVFVDPSRTR